MALGYAQGFEMLGGLPKAMAWGMSKVVAWGMPKTLKCFRSVQGYMWLGICPELTMLGVCPRLCISYSGINLTLDRGVPVFTG